MQPQANYGDPKCGGHVYRAMGETQVPCRVLGMDDTLANDGDSWYR